MRHYLDVFFFSEVSCIRIYWCVINCLNMVCGFGVFVFSFLILVFQECGIQCIKVWIFLKNHLGVGCKFLGIYYMGKTSLMRHHICH